MKTINILRAGAAGAVFMLTTFVSAQVINVKDSPYNATGNGSTDDTSAISSALSAISSSGELYFPAGTYKITSGLSFSSKDIKFRGDGSSSSTIKLSTNNATLVSASFGNDKGQNLTLEGITLTTTGTGNTAVSASYNTTPNIQPMNFDPGFIARDLTITVTGGSWTTGIYLSSNPNIKIRDSSITGSSSASGTGLVFTNYCLNTVIDGTTFSGWKKAIVVDGGGGQNEGIVINNCAFSNVNWGLYSAATNDTLWISVTNCSSFECAAPSGGESYSACIEFARVFDLIIRNNTFKTLTDTSHNSYQLAVASQNSVITNNTFRNNDPSHGTGGVVILAAGGTTNIHNNAFVDINSSASIWIQAGAGECMITNSSFTNCGWHIYDEDGGTYQNNN